LDFSLNRITSVIPLKSPIALWRRIIFVLQQHARRFSDALFAISQRTPANLPVRSPRLRRSKLMAIDPQPATRRGGVPRGLLDTGPTILSYGFRPFFLGGAFWATMAMTLWMASIFAGMQIGGDYGARA
jgi:hypothetical protein